MLLARLKRHALAGLSLNGRRGRLVVRSFSNHRLENTEADPAEGTHVSVSYVARSIDVMRLFQQYYVAESEPLVTDKRCVIVKLNPSLPRSDSVLGGRSSRKLPSDASWAKITSAARVHSGSHQASGAAWTPSSQSYMPARAKPTDPLDAEAMYGVFFVSVPVFEGMDYFPAP